MEIRWKGFFVNTLWRIETTEQYQTPWKHISLFSGLEFGHPFLRYAIKPPWTNQTTSALTIKTQPLTIFSKSLAISASSWCPFGSDRPEQWLVRWVRTAKNLSVTIKQLSFGSAQLLSELLGDLLDNEDQWRKRQHHPLPSLRGEKSTSPSKISVDKRFSPHVMSSWISHTWVVFSAPYWCL